MAASTQTQPRILVMSPRPEPLDDLAELLDREGWSPRVVSDAIGLFSIVKAHHVDLVLVHLPLDETVRMDLPNVLRAVHWGGYLPVMILAEGSGQDQRCHWLDGGADDVADARTGAPEILARIRSLLRVKELTDQLTVSRAALQEAMRRERKLLARLRRDNAHLQTLATTDPLTHVQNVRSFHDLLEHEFRVAKRYHKPLSMLQLDVDHFKVVNDNYGHPSGDYVLKELAVILKRSVRESDVVARTGGEEFSILLPRADRSQAAQFAERIRSEVSARQFSVYGRDIHVTISIGSATYPQDAEITSPDMLAYFADQCLLLAKEGGRDRVRGFCELTADRRRRLRRECLATEAQAPAAPGAPEGAPIGGETVDSPESAL